MATIIDTGIFFLKRNYHLLLFQASPFLFLRLISTCPFISTRIHRLHCSSNSGQEESSSRRSLKGLVLHEIHPGVRNSRLCWINAWVKRLRSRWQKVPGKRFLRNPSPIMQEHQGQFGQSKIKVPRSPFTLFCPPIFSLVPYFVRMYYILFFATLVLILALTIKYVTCFPLVPLVASPIISFCLMKLSFQQILKKNSAYIILEVLAHSKLLFIA